MTGMAFRGAVVGALMLLGGSTAAQEPVLPAPRPLRTEIVGPISFIRPDPMAVWQDYGVDRRGRFRPLVAPIYGEFRYAATGEPYPWWQNHPTWMTPMAGNPATFDQPPVAPLIIIQPAPAWDRMPYAE